MYPASLVGALLPAIMDIRACPFSLLARPLSASWVTRLPDTTARPFSISFFLSQTSVELQSVIFNALCVLCDQGRFITAAVIEHAPSNANSQDVMVHALGCSVQP